MKFLRSDNGAKLMKLKIEEVCTKSEAMHQLMVPYDPQQNGIARRVVCSITEKVRSIIHYQGMTSEW